MRSRRIADRFTDYERIPNGAAMSGQAKPADLSIGTFSDEQLSAVMGGFGITDFIVLPFFALDRNVLDLRRRTDTARKVFVECGGAVRFLKELPWYCASVENAAFQAAFQRHLAASGVPVPTLHSGVDGRPFVHDRLRGSVFMLYDYVDGRSGDLGPEDAKAAGRVLGQMHLAARQSPPPAGAARRESFDSALDLVGLLEHHWDGGGTAAGRELIALEQSVIRDCAARARERGYGARPTAVHGDFNPYNLIFGDQGVRAIVDFDNACIDDPAHDLAEALVRYAWMRYEGLSSSYGEVPNGYRDAVAAALASGYREANPEGFAAAAPHLPDVMTAIALELSAIGLLASYYSSEDVDRLAVNARELRGLSAAVVDRFG